jgi:pyridoxal phosphate enzyme (YggS family)
VNPDARLAELSANLGALDKRISAACAEAGRDRQSVTLVAVTKTFPASDVELLASLGITDVAENRDQEARAKSAQTSADVRWHFVGQIQRNKAASVASYSDVVHSADRPELITALARGSARRRASALGVLIQVNLDPSEPGELGPRGGAHPADAPGLGELVESEPSLRLRGVMAVAPRGADPDAAFAQLAAVSRVLRARFPGAAWISAGMSGDLESAIRHGATHVRVGGDLLGSRSRLRGTVAG